MQDALLQSLIYVSRYYGLSNSPQALTNGLPLSDGKLTPFYLPALRLVQGFSRKSRKPSSRRYRK